jgi:hypothetical protein
MGFLVMGWDRVFGDVVGWEAFGSLQVNAVDNCMNVIKKLIV